MYQSPRWVCRFVMVALCTFLLAAEVSWAGCDDCGGEHETSQCPEAKGDGSKPDDSVESSQTPPSESTRCCDGACACAALWENFPQLSEMTSFIAGLYAAQMRCTHIWLKSLQAALINSLLDMVRLGNDGEIRAGQQQTELTQPDQNEQNMMQSFRSSIEADQSGGWDAVSTILDPEIITSQIRDNEVFASGSPVRSADLMLYAEFPHANKNGDSLEVSNNRAERFAVLRVSLIGHESGGDRQLLVFVEEQVVRIPGDDLRSAVTQVCQNLWGVLNQQPSDSRGIERFRFDVLFSNTYYTDSDSDSDGLVASSGGDSKEGEEANEDPAERAGNQLTEDDPASDQSKNTE